VIIGVSGPNGAGKGELVAYLADRSFSVHSLSDVIREELARRGETESREHMIELGRELRATGGPGALAGMLTAKLASDRNHAVDSIRHPAEVEALRSHSPDFKLVWVEAPLELRFSRMQARGRPGDPTSLEDMQRLEDRERGSSDESAQQLDAVRSMADFVVENRGGLDELHREIHRVFRECLYFDRPSWDEYFMGIARVVASRSNCVKRKVAAVVTVDRRIISTGYNGTPRGTKNCNEGGCPRCNELAIGGTALADCLCSHGEENAITQAAYHGVSLRSGTIYTTFSPCLQCTKLIINAGLSEVVYNVGYPLGEVSLALLGEAGVKVRQASPSHR
jgi:dCMP deaminase